MTKRWLKLAAVPVALSIIAVSCGSDDDSDSGSGDTTEDTTEGTDGGDDTGDAAGGTAVENGPYNDVDFFYLPPIGDEFGKPMLTAGTFATAFTADEDAMAALEYLASPEYVEARLATGVGGFLSANSNVPLESYPTPLEQSLVELLTTSEVARFDAGDLMPGVVGSGSFWSGIVDITTESKTVAEAFAEIESTWPEEASPASECAPQEIVPGDGSITIFGPEVEQELEGFIASMEPFTEATGIEVTITGDRSAAEQIGVQVEGGSAPDIMIFPQPGRLIDFARSCDLVPLADNVTAAISANFEGFDELGNVDDIAYGVPNKSDVKSLVWYSPSAFETGGYTIPDTHEQFIALMDQMVADGNTPLCIGIGSDAATGWPGTDWTEDYMLRLKGPEVYDQWVNHEIPFDDPDVIEVGEFWFDIWSNPDYVFGGLPYVASTPFSDAGLPILDGECMMYRMANFFASQWPEGTQVGPAE